MENLEEIRAKAEELGLEGEDKDDWVEAKMRRLGFKKGPGEWIREEDDDEPKDDDDQPVTRADIRRMERERRKSAATNTPPKVDKTKDEGTKTPVRKNANTSTWWK
jgi:hypothetical protein